MQVRLSKFLKQEYLNLLSAKGEIGLYHYLVINCAVRLNGDIKKVDLEFLNLADSFFSLSRTTKDKRYFTIGKVLRRVAHKFYRKLNMSTENDARFLKLIYSAPKVQIVTSKTAK